MTAEELAVIIRQNPGIDRTKVEAAGALLQKLDRAGIPDSPYAIETPYVTNRPKVKASDPRTVHLR